MASETRFTEEMARQWKLNYESLNNDTEQVLQNIQNALDELAGSTSEDDILVIIGQVNDDVISSFTELVNAFAGLFDSVSGVIQSYTQLIAEAGEVIKTVVPLL